MAENVKISKTLSNWSLLIGGALVVLFVFRVIYSKNHVTSTGSEYPITVTFDDVGSLEKDLNELSKDTMTSDLSDFDKSLE